jgi:hypothetical protein
MQWADLLVSVNNFKEFAIEKEIIFVRQTRLGWGLDNNKEAPRFCI